MSEGDHRSAYVQNNPWLITRRGAVVGRARSRQEAIRYADRRRHLRTPETFIRDRRTGETWGFGRAGWHRVADPRPLSAPRHDDAAGSAAA